MLTYAGIPSQISAPVITIQSGDLTSPVSGSLYWQMRNRQGFNLYSPPTTINLTPGQGISIVVPDCNCEGYEAIEYILSFSPTNTYLAAYVVATYSAFDTLPGEIVLNKNDYFLIQLSVANTSGLPTNKINGGRVYVDSWGEIREWNNGSYRKVYPQSFQTLISGTKAVNGCDRLLSEFTEEQKQIIIKPSYAVDRSYSEPVRFWLRNETSSPFFSGRAITVSISSSGSDLTELFFGAGAVNLTFLGYVNLSDGTLDTSGINGGQMPGINQRITYSNNNSGLLLEKDLPVNYAYCVDIEIQTDINSLGGRLSENAVIEIGLNIADRTGYYSGIADLMGNMIGSSLDKRRIVPGVGLNAIALPGSGIVNGRSFIGAGERTVFGIAANTSNQTVAINGNGTCLVVSSLSTSQVLRAKIGTLNGIGKIVNIGYIALDTSKQLRIQLTHPVAIRDDYPDVVRGNTKGRFNATSIYVWVGSKRFIIPVENGEETQTIILTGAGGDVLTIPVSELGLYKPIINNCALISGSSSFNTGDYQINIAYYYENTVTSISHQGIIELESDFLAFIETTAKKQALVFG